MLSVHSLPDASKGNDMRKRTNGMLLEKSSASMHLRSLVQGSSAQAGALRICAGALALALSANLEIPLQPVPFTLQILALGFIAAMLKPKEAASAAGAYVAAGALGAPVFAGGLGGVWRLAGPTGGFILGFVAGAWAGSYLLSQLSKTRLHWAVSCFLSVAAMTAVVYLAGWAQLALVAQLSPTAAFAAGVEPFVVFDLMKAGLVASVLAAGRIAAREVRR
jgi:biotin transport system substrate-specific component